MRKITKLELSIPAVSSKKKVAAYARVSMETERLNHSLSAQISYYNALIQKSLSGSLRVCTQIMASAEPAQPSVQSSAVCLRTAKKDTSKSYSED